MNNGSVSVLQRLQVLQVLQLLALNGKSKRAILQNNPLRMTNLTINDEQSYRIFGTIVVASSLLFILLYIAVLTVLMSAEFRRIIAYRLLFAVGVSDCVQLLVHATCGVAVLLQFHLPYAINKRSSKLSRHEMVLVIQTFSSLVCYILAFVFWTFIHPMLLNESLCANFLSILIWITMNGANPVVYIIVNRPLRQSLRRILGCA
ncbi:hypothetical protein Y032_0298g1757 [Ancylostoma ceylanicum]|uniref:G-protein coupled receptors family 1 profile domain-containing protein n=1 Tax=Ancylostoma ceylanicum TaxID=53326 RepID=A0A016S5C4_9BILA|nr:hypothetical protein Y032_0298g1757 [Ancylostoma ceylanicum]